MLRVCCTSPQCWVRLGTAHTTKKAHRACRCVRVTPPLSGSKRGVSPCMLSDSCACRAHAHHVKHHPRIIHLCMCGASSAHHTLVYHTLVYVRSDHQTIKPSKPLHAPPSSRHFPSCRHPPSAVWMRGARFVGTWWLAWRTLRGGCSLRRWRSWSAEEVR